MTAFDIEYAVDRQPLQELLESVDRPGGFCTHGRLFVPMPRLEVEGVGVLSFPVLDSQVRALVEVAERAPYGKGTDTLVDTSVRDCRQIGAARIRLGGGAWAETLSTILDAAAAGLGCPKGRLDAQLYKLLIYETGGFFAPHRDTEKAGGMIATLSVSLPVSGAGGELIVRHRDREVRIDMDANEPSELAYAAFYADCTHETRPVREGHRLSLVFNLCLRPGDTETPRQAPDYSDRVRDIAEQLIAWRDDEDGRDKLVWLLDHNYSEAGLSFDALKNADAALAGVLKPAADRADCELYAAIVHIEEEGSVLYSGGKYFDDWHWDGSDADAEMDEVLDGGYWLDGWVNRDGGRPALGRVRLNPEELLPAAALDDVEPDEQWVNEATGNEGVTVERAYRHAAFAIWPRPRTLNILANEGIGAAVAWVAERMERDRAAAPELISRLIGIWRTAANRRGGDGRAQTLRLLGELGYTPLALRFLREIVLLDYDGDENEHLPAALGVVGPGAAGGFLTDLVNSRFASRPDATLALLLRVGELPDFEWRDTLRDSVRAVLSELPAALSPRKEAREVTWAADLESLGREPPCGQLGEEAIRDLFALAWRCGLTEEAEAATVVIADHPEAVEAERTIPAALDALYREESFAESAAYLGLWGHAADSILTRSAEPPREPQDWRIAADVSCNCENCEALKRFCKDPTAQVGRFPLRKELRKHLHRQIDGHGLDMSHVTERRGSPYTLVCTKNRASYRRRLAEYGEDISCMRSLTRLVPVAEGNEAVVAQLLRLRAAVSAAG